MGNTREGALKAKATMIANLGGEEAYREYIIKRGRKGGKAKTDKPKGFAARPDLAAKAGRKAGSMLRVKP